MDDDLPGEIVDASTLRPGDVISRSTWNTEDRAEIIGPSRPHERDPFGRSGFIEYPARAMDGSGRTGILVYGAGGRVRRLSAAS